ncbi:hypothetical protein [Paracoccus aminovorans]|uniref:hypothetical protein n=1 Tax=Paracoccus aminovorans TaxID=34004 RepID=UPI00147EE2AA|nr:hypothetical protein [Paracoccus aminovorans]
MPCWTGSTGTNAASACSIRNGDAVNHLLADGTIRLEDKRIVQRADRDIALSAAWIDLN